MVIFDKYIHKIKEICSAQKIMKLECPDFCWEIENRNSFLMERDTFIELGGYPEESINIVTFYNDPNMGFSEGIYCIGDPKLLQKKGHISFGKLVLLETDDIPDSGLYAFTQEELLTDSKIRMKDVMLRQSAVSYNVNMRVGKKAVEAGFSLELMGKTIFESFCRLNHVRKVTVIMILGENSIYKELLGCAEKIKEITLTLNHVFDGIAMDCGHCEVKEICNEVEGMRELHQKRKMEKSR